MADGEEEERWREQLIFARHVQMRDWALSAKLPDPNHDSKNGWTLDQFAMRFAPVLLRRYKKAMAALHKSGNRNRDRSYDWLEADLKLSGELKAHLLDPRFRVEGYQPGSYIPTVIPRALLETLHPVVETSELCERGLIQTPRIFEKVRIYPPVDKATAGRKATYDWRALHQLFEQEKPIIRTFAELVECCRSRVKPMPGKLASKHGPDDKTIRDAISKYGLEKFITRQK
jgi:hypothetical protein